MNSEKKCRKEKPKREIKIKPSQVFIITWVIFLLVVQIGLWCSASEQKAIRAEDLKETNTKVQVAEKIEDREGYYLIINKPGSTKMKELKVERATYATTKKGDYRNFKLSREFWEGPSEDRGITVWETLSIIVAISIFVSLGPIMDECNNTGCLWSFLGFLSTISFIIYIIYI